MADEFHLERIRRNARRLKRERSKGLVGIPFFVAITLVFAAAAIFAETTLIRIGCAIFAVSWAYSAYRITYANWASSPTDVCLTHYRVHLIRQRDTFQDFHYWSTLPSSCGVALATLGWYLAEPSRAYDVFMVVFFWIGFQIALWMHRSGELARWKKEIDLLDAA